MNINEILTQAKINGAEGAQAAIDSLGEIIDEHETAVIAAIDAYYAGAAKIEDTVKQRLNALAAQQGRINSEIAAMGPALTQATVSGDTDQLKHIQAKLSELEAQKAATATQIEMLNISQFPNDAKLYKEAAAYRQKQLSTLEEASEAKNEICSYIREQISAWEAVLTSAHAYGTQDRLMKRYTAMHDDYHSKETIGERLVRREQEAAKKAEHDRVLERQHARFAKMGLRFDRETGRYVEVGR